MRRISTATREVDKFGSGKDGHTNGVPSVTPTTQEDENIFNDLQESIVNTIEDLGMPVIVDDTLAVVAQLSQAIQASISRLALGVRTGVVDGASHADVIYDEENDVYVMCTGVPDFETSPIGTAWTNQAASGSESQNAIATDNAGVICSVGDQGDCYTSADATTFSIQTLGAAVDMFGVVWDATNSQFVTVGDGTSHYTSPTGVTWTAQTKNESLTIYRGIAEGGGRLVAVGDGGDIETSDDAGVTWDLQTSGVAADLTSVAYAANGRGVGLPLWVAVGATGTVISSPDAETWTAHVLPTNTTDSLLTVRHLSDRVGWLMGGSGGRVYHGAHPGSLRELWLYFAEAGASDILGFAGPPSYLVGRVVTARQSTQIDYSEPV
jgi:hypothetical protein